MVVAPLVRVSTHLLAAARVYGGDCGPKGEETGRGNWANSESSHFSKVFLVSTRHRENSVNPPEGAPVGRGAFHGGFSAEACVRPELRQLPAPPWPPPGSAPISPFMDLSGTGKQLRTSKQPNVHANKVDRKTCVYDWWEYKKALFERQSHHWCEPRKSWGPVTSLCEFDSTKHSDPEQEMRGCLTKSGQPKLS